ncbi:MAG TPA: hypothetical protein VLW17_13850 [Thermoanaerobaculaceae bacterium]|nr:hypothetical protein [Thermoanaerobaculaceae bacterium]
MRKVLLCLVVFGLVSSVAIGSELVRSHLNPAVSPQVMVSTGQLQAKLVALYGVNALSQNLYVGANICLACHNGKNGLEDKSTWLHTRHSQMLRRPMGIYSTIAGKGVIANQAGVANKDDFMAGLDLGTLAAFSKFGANAPKLSYDAATDTYWMTIGALKCKVVATVAGSEGGQGQRYLLRVPVTDTDTKLSKALYFAPATFTPGTGWASATGWYDSSNNPKFTASVTSAQLVASGGPSSHTKSCVGCHITGIRSLGTTAAGEATVLPYFATAYDINDPDYFDYNGDGNFNLVNITCESCHGPGAQHVMGGGDTSKIVNPAKLKGAQSAEICGRCHVTGTSVPNGTYAWPYDDANMVDWIPLNTPVPLASFYNSTVKIWPDGWLPNGGRPYDAFIKSAHYSTKYGQNGSSIPCSDCHDPHDKQQDSQIVTSRPGEGSASNITIATAVDNDTLCLSCHATHTFPTITYQMVADYANNLDAIAKGVSAHTFHPYAPERTMGLSRCTTCHMSVSGSHTWEPIEPEKTIMFQSKGGMPNMCAAGCHATLVNASIPGSATPGTEATPNWSGQFEQDLATALMAKYGPNGVWWKHTIPPSEIVGQ